MAEGAGAGRVTDGGVVVADASVEGAAKAAELVNSDAASVSEIAAYATDLRARMSGMVLRFDRLVRKPGLRRLVRKEAWTVPHHTALSHPNPILGCSGPADKGRRGACGFRHDRRPPRPGSYRIPSASKQGACHRATARLLRPGSYLSLIHI